jgi:hypothetical protein
MNLANDCLDQHLATVMTDEIAKLIDDYRNRRKDVEDDCAQTQNYLKTYYYVFEFNSPYAEVRASVSNTDDPTLPVETFRAWFLGMFFGSLCGAANQVLIILLYY